MNAIFAELLTVAKKLNNYEDDATSGTLWTSTQTFEVVVPTDKRWFVLGGQVTRDVSSTVIITARDAADKIITMIYSAGAGTGTNAWPNTVASASTYPFAVPLILEAGEYIYMAFGTAQGATAHASCMVLEVDV